MGRSLGMEVVAEVVESLRHLDFLRRNACHYAQGKLFGEPCTAEDLLALLMRQASGTARLHTCCTRQTNSPPGRPD